MNNQKTITLPLDLYNNELSQQQALGMHKIKAALLVELRKGNKAFNDYVSSLELLEAEEAKAKMSADPSSNVTIVPMTNKPVDYIGNLIVEFFKDKAQVASEEQK